MSKERLEEITMKLEFAMPMQFKSDYFKNSNDDKERNIYRSWREELEGKTWYLLGWHDSAYAITDKLGSYSFKYISGNPSDLFEALEESE